MQINWNFFDGFKNHSQRAQLGYQASGLESNKALLIRSWTVSLEHAKGQLARAQARIDAGKVSLDAAKEFELEVKNSLQKGEASIPDLTNASIARTQADLVLEQALFTKRTAVLSALYAAGVELHF
jgi:hypothetical protein